MQLQRNEILTGLLVLATVAVLTGILILLGAPGLFRPLVTYRIYMDNAAGIKLGAPVLLAGRKIGQVDKLFSPVSKEDAQHAEAAAAKLKELQTTSQVVGGITDEYSQLNMALAQMRTFAENLTNMTAPDSSNSLALNNIEKISTDLSSNDNIQITLPNFRESSDKL